MKEETYKFLRAEQQRCIKMMDEFGFAPHSWFNGEVTEVIMWDGQIIDLDILRNERRNEANS